MHPPRLILLCVTAILAIAGCDSGTPKPDPAHVVEAIDEQKSSSAASAPHPVATPTLAIVDTLAGEWRVAGIDGREFDEPYGLALSGDGHALWWNPRCAQQERYYTIDGLSAGFVRADDSVGPRAGPPCLPALPAQLTEVMRTLDAATKIGRTTNNGIEISGGGHSVLLFAQ